MAMLDHSRNLVGALSVCVLAVYISTACAAQTCAPDWWTSELHDYLVGSLRWSGWGLWSQKRRDSVQAGLPVMGPTVPYLPRRRTWNEECTLLAWVSEKSYPHDWRFRDTNRLWHTGTGIALVCCRVTEWRGDTVWLLTETALAAQASGDRLCTAPDFKFFLDDSLNYIRDMLTPDEIADVAKEIPAVRLLRPPTNRDIMAFVAAIAKTNRPELSWLMYSDVPLMRSDSLDITEGDVCGNAWRAVVGDDPPNRRGR
ncbi:MAG TPA: hypothetical protein VHI13_07455 [Candidatus Kapabacteria bacterium]|nr:hypothetical protein [Candidatus Kapabacteria bacterium]